jgi:catechol 2,3-dioxygenase-like lactoylglutathione lyase family enzyme
MVNAMDRIVLTVPDLEVSCADYRRLTGAPAWPVAQPGGRRAAWIGLDNTVLELVEGDVERASVSGIVFRSAGAGYEPQPLANELDLDIACCDGEATGEFRQSRPGSQCERFRVDHLVLRTRDAQACIALFTDRLGVRLALDKTVPEWGGRMLFFRTGQLTLEVIEAEKDKPSRDRFWGIAYQCPDIQETVELLLESGVEVSDIRAGRKPGTRVATVKSACQGIPTLLIEPTT